MKFKGIYINIAILSLVMIIVSACQNNQKISSEKKHNAEVVVGGKGSLPPAYLSIPGFQKCTKTKSMGSWKSICLPINKPVTCSQKTWKKLQETKIPSC
jgi:hypothetical protein